MEQKIFNIPMSMTVEIKVDSDQLKYGLGEQDRLRDKEVIGFEVSSVTDITKSPLNRALIADTVFKQAYISLAEGSSTNIDTLPFNAAYPKNNNGRVLMFDKPKKLDFPNSFISIPAAGQITTGTSFLIIFYYREPGGGNVKC